MAKESKSKVCMGKKTTKTSESLPISDGLVMYLYDAGDSGTRYVRVDFNDYSYYKDLCMVMDRSKLREMADFLNKHLGNNI